MKKTILLIISVLLAITCLTSCGDKKPFDDELVIAYVNETYSHYFKKNNIQEEALSFYKQYGIKYKKKNGQYILNLLSCKQNDITASSFIDRTLNDPEFYKRNESLFKYYYPVTENLIEEFLATGVVPYPISDYIDVGGCEELFFDKELIVAWDENNPYKKCRSYLTPLEKERIKRDYKGSEQCINTVKEITNIISEKFIALYKQKKYDIVKNVTFPDSYSQYFDKKSGYLDPDISIKEDFFPCDFYYYQAELAGNDNYGSNYSIYDYAINLHDRMNHENCSSFQVMSDRLDLMNTINSTDWKLYYLNGEYITDEEVMGASYLRMLEFKEGSDEVIYNISDKELKGNLYYKNGTPYLEIWGQVKGSEHTYKGKLSVTKNKDGKLQLSWKGTGYIISGWDGYHFPIDIRFTN